MLLTLLKDRRVSKSPSLVEQSKQMDVSIQIPTNSHLYDQLKMIDLTEKDLAIALTVKPYIEENIVTIVDSFYKKLEHHRPLINIINNNSSIERLKRSLQIHIVEMFSGHINEQFLSKRKIIALTHVKVGLTQKWYIASFQTIYNEISEVLYTVLSSRQDWKIAMQAVYKLLNLEEQIVLEAYDDEMMALKEKEYEYQKSIITSVEHTATELNALAEQTTAAIEEMTAQIHLITTNSQEGTKMAVEAENVSENGREQMATMNKALLGLQTSTMSANDKMMDLEKTSQEIKSIVEIVKSIAEQTNLLSLNASIEAARAGEHGQGFAVVAEEVRKLAVQTEEAVKDVTDLVIETNHQVTDSAGSLQESQRYLTDVEQHMKNTEFSFQAIREQMEKTKDVNVAIQADLESMEEVLKDIVTVATSTSESAEQLTYILDE